MRQPVSVLASLLLAAGVVRTASHPAEEALGLEISLLASLRAALESPPRPRALWRDPGRITSGVFIAPSFLSPAACRELLRTSRGDAILPASTVTARVDAARKAWTAAVDPTRYKTNWALRSLATQARATTRGAAQRSCFCFCGALSSDQRMLTRGAMTPTSQVNRVTGVAGAWERSAEVQYNAYEVNKIRLVHAWLRGRLCLYGCCFSSKHRVYFISCLLYYYIDAIRPADFTSFIWTQSQELFLES